MTCGDVKDRMVDFLYGELAEADRTAFAAHTAGCDGCRDEARGLGQALGRTRAALQASDDEPPARVRVAVLAAARQAAAPVDGLWAWLRRPWLLPAFAAASAIGIFALTREIVVEPARQAAQETVTAARQYENAAARQAAPPTEELKLARDEALDLPSAQPRPEPAKPAVALADEPARARPKRVRQSAPAPGGGRFAEPPPADGKKESAVPGQAGAKGAPAPGEAEGDADSVAESAVRAQAPLAKSKAFYDDPSGGLGAASAAAPAASAPAAPPPPAPRAATQAAAEKSSRGALAPVESQERERRDSVVELSRRADRAFSEKRWADAVAGYQGLLQRYPQHRDAAIWRERVGIARRDGKPVSPAAARPAKRSGDALEGLKL